MKKFYLAILSLFLFSNFLFSQSENQQIFRCNTDEKTREYFRNNGLNPDELNISTHLRNSLASCTNFGIYNGYGTGCLNDCSFTDNIPTSDCNKCGSNTFGNYLVPVKVWILADDNGSNRAVTDAQIANHIGYINAYHCCKGIPISLYQIDNPTQINNTDWNDCDNKSTLESDDDAAITSANYTPNVINIYIPKKLNDNGATTGCNGYAALPFGNSAANNRMFMDATCITPTVSNVCTNTEVATVIIHELGHMLGLNHTHDTSTPDNPTITTDDCTSGDFILDTDEDPDFSGGEVAPSGCIAIPQPGCTFTSSAATTTQCALYGTPNTVNNIMCYNYYNGCRQNYTTCQKAKMVDALVCSRSYLCDPIANRFFTSTTVNDANSPLKEICINGAIPTFNATNSSRTSSIAGTCRFNWYTTATGGIAVESNSASFTPTSAQLNTAVAGTYYFYLAEVNAVNQDCRQRVEVKVLPTPGNGSPSALSFNDNTTTAQTLAVSGANLSTNQYSGWIITTTNPSSSTNSAIYTAASGTTCPTTVTGTNVNCILKSGSAPSSSLSMDCNEGTNYYAIPFASNYLAGTSSATCSPTAASSSVSLGGTNVGEWARMNASQVTCRPASPNTPTFTFTVQISGYTGPVNGLGINLRESSACNTASVVASLLAGNGTYNYTQSNFTSGFDPGSTGMCALLFQNGGGDVSSISMNITLNITYPGTTAIPFPSITALDATCTYGTPVTITCLAPLSVELTSFSALLNDQNQVKLDWTTSSEINNAYFSIEKSSNGIDYEVLKLVDGAGNTTETKKYSAYDTKPNKGLNYYRLSQVDFDGKSTIAGIRSINLEIDEASVIAYPNPVASPHNLSLDYSTPFEGAVSVEIIDITGKLVSFENKIARKGPNNYQLNIENIPNGTYLIRMTQSNSVVSTKMVKL